MDIAIAWIHHYGYPAIFILLMLGIVGLPIPDETVLVFVGYLSFKGDLSAPLSLASATLGSACGITVSYLLGRFIGLPAIMKLAPYLHLRSESLTKTHQWVERWGKYSLLIAYFIPGVRHLAALMAGAATLPPTTFARFAYVGALMWASTFIGLGYVAGEEWEQLTSLPYRLWILGCTLVVLVGTMIFFVLRRRAQPRG